MKKEIRPGTLYTCMYMKDVYKGKEYPYGRARNFSSLVLDDLLGAVSLLLHQKIDLPCTFRIFFPCLFGWMWNRKILHAKVFIFNLNPCM